MSAYQTIIKQRVASHCCLKPRNCDSKSTTSWAGVFMLFLEPVIVQKHLLLPYTHRHTCLHRSHKLLWYRMWRCAVCQKEIYMQDQNWLLLALVVVRRSMRHSDVNPTPFNTVITEPKVSTSLILNLIIGHCSGPVPSTFHLQNVSPWDLSYWLTNSVVAELTYSTIY